MENSDRKPKIITSRLAYSAQKTSSPYEKAGFGTKENKNYGHNHDGFKENFWQGLNNDSMEHEDQQAIKN